MFREGNLVVVDIDAVRGVIEVKSTLTHELLRSSLNILQPIDRDHGPPIFKGVFAYRTDIPSAGSAIDTIIDFYDQQNEDLETFAALADPTEIVTAVCVHKQMLISIRFSRVTDPQILVPYLFSIRDVVSRSPQTALFFYALNQHVRGERPTVSIRWAPLSKLNFIARKTKTSMMGMGPLLDGRGRRI